MQKGLVIKLMVINMLAVVTVILPFLPGPPNWFAIILSAAVELIGFFGFVLIPAGLFGCG